MRSIISYSNSHLQHMDYSKPAHTDAVTAAIAALEQNGIEARLVTKEDVKAEVLEMLPEGANVLQASSVTLDSLGISDAINNSGKFDAVKPKLAKMNRDEQGREMQMLGAAPTYVVGSVHAVTEDGKVIVVSNTGSQLSSYVFGAEKVIWVVGTQKLVPDLNTAMERINEYVLPLESERLNKAYNMTMGSFVSKVLIFNREIKPGRITLLFVDEALGF